MHLLYCWLVDHMYMYTLFVASVGTERFKTNWCDIKNQCRDNYTVFIIVERKTKIIIMNNKADNYQPLEKLSVVFDIFGPDQNIWVVDLNVLFILCCKHLLLLILLLVKPCGGILVFTLWCFVTLPPWTSYQTWAQCYFIKQLLHLYRRSPYITLQYISWPLLLSYGYYSSLISDKW